jgi:transposase InsO family protein
LTVSSICEKYQIPRSTFYRKKKILDNEGPWGLAPKRRGPKGSRLPLETKRRIKELRRYQISTKSISAMISVENQSTLPESTTYHYLKSIGKSRLKRNKKRRKVIYKRFERSKPNELWQIDNVGPFYKPGKLFAYNVIDDHSRYNIATMISDNQSSQSWIDMLEKLVQKYGVPDAILHDNGSQFVGTKYKKFLKKYGIRSVRSRVRHPQTCGKVERMQQSLQYEIRDLVFTSSIAELQMAVNAWRMFYNEVRPHSTTGMTPHERYFGKASTNKLSACQFYEQMLINYSGW